MRPAPLLLLLVAACSSSGNPATPPGVDGGSPSVDAARGGDAALAADAAAPQRGDGGYADPSMWLCGAGAPHDYCLDAQTATALNADGTESAVTITTAPSPAVDCFYVYPSVDITSPPGNEPDFSNLPSILDPVREQAAPFRQACKLYAPLYHQATLKSYYDASASTYLEAAYADVAAAFAEYMTAFNQGRDFVLIGHSQGSHMLRRLIQREIEGKPIASHLVLAILGGAFGDVTVPKGKLVGGTFQTTPLCSADAQRGCVITWNTFAKGYEPPASWGTTNVPVPPGQDMACVNPAALGGGMARLSGSWFFTQFQNPSIDPPQSTGVSSTFAVVPDFFTGQCATSVSGFSFFEVTAAPNAGDKRLNPINFGDPYYVPTFLGLHLLDYSFPMQDLVAAVAKRAGGAAVDAGAD
jgi:hypothetical protein